ncbi:hypothetical protein BEWA_008850 [Theileria equi strain WA]|uniref:Uncharacterized protein n=1 Tax=Theileria equi strain WA TaxID=1537102 RepID=L0B1X1_THEEQ|nr:hypothetical protein BEWA_008850 [Theileria equi strain WA]AFZ81473.1 hypothetical protein BEWA_008850 [Theileria equi strain WA]|eukprot:XP_004831139.1 hypothetical protein BEWA_008850 [Theileria equi strain WA]
MSKRPEGGSGAEASPKKAKKNNRPGDSSKQAQKTSKNPGKKGKQAVDGAKPVDIKTFSTLQEYKEFISQICTKAITYPESSLKDVNVLFEIVEKRGGGPEPLLDHVKRLALLSLVSVICHMLPRVSYELQDSGANAVQKAEGMHASDVIEEEKAITTNTLELRDKLIKFINSNLTKGSSNSAKKGSSLAGYSSPTANADLGITSNESICVHLISRLTCADNRVCNELLSLSLKYSRHSKSCLNAINELFTSGRIPDIHRYLQFMLKSPFINHLVVDIINRIPINKKQHEYSLSESSTDTSVPSKKSSHGKTKNRNLRKKCGINMMQSCIEGIGKYGMIMDDNIRIELITEIRNALKNMNKAPVLISGLSSSIKLAKMVKNIEFTWIYETFIRLCKNALPFLVQGELFKGSGNSLDVTNSINFGSPLYAYKFLDCLENLSALLSNSKAVSDNEILAQFLQELLSISLVIDSNIAAPILIYVRDILAKVPKLQELISLDGMRFSVLSKTKSSFWELQLLSSHFSPTIKSIANSLSDPTAIDSKRPFILPMGHGINTSKPCHMSGVDVYHILVSSDFNEILNFS